MKQLKKKGSVFDSLSAIGVGIATLAITLVVVFLLLSNMAANSSVAADSNASAAIDTLQESADDIPGWVPLLVIGIVGALLIGLVALYKGRS